MRTRQAILVAPGRLELRDATLEVGDDELLVRVAVCGLCPWELNHFRGRLGTCPQTLGHEVAGTVVATGPSVRGFAVGEAVTGLPAELAGFADLVRMPAATSVKVRDPARLREALGEPLSCVVTTLRGAEPSAGDVGVVLGCGPMGLLCIQGLGRSLLSMLVAVDVDEQRLALARRFGATHTMLAGRDDPVRTLAQLTDGKLADFVIEASGHPPVLAGAHAFLKTGRGRLIIMGSHEQRVPIDIEALQRKGAIIHVTHPAYASDPTDNLRRAVAMFNAGTFDLGPLITHSFSLERIQEAFEALASRPAGYLKGVVIP